MTAPRVPTFATVALVLFAAPSGAQAFAAPSFARPTWTSAQSFTTVTGVRELSSGSVLVADFSEPMVHLLAPGGQSAKQIGRKGSGPREYLTPLRLIALPNDSTLLIDRDADRYLIIAPNGDIVATTPFPEQMRLAGQYIRGADQGGRLYFQIRYIAPEPTAPSTTGILRWDRRSVRFDSLGFVKMPSATPIGGKLANGASYQGMRIMPYTPADAWTVAPDGRIAMIRVAPYRVDWLATGRPPVVGGAIPYSPVPVTDADRKANEPKGPPFTLVYAEVKPPFSNDAVVLDDRARLWIGRSFTRGAKTRDWDVVDSQGKLLKTINLAADKWIMAVTARFVYVLWRDQDDVEWLQAYAR